MVAVQVAYEDVVKAGKFEVHAPHLKLCSLTAVNHHKVPAHVKHLA